MSSLDNKRVAKNAVALTLRMVLVTIVGLYTSRVVLEALGVDDYGIYGVVGGIVGMASFLNSSMAGATSRFITFELGKSDKTKLNRIFSTALIIHLVIAMVVTVLAETIGLWFVNNKMNFPTNSMLAVNILYQFTIVSMIFNFTQVPYTSTIIAYERMNIYAYLEIINVVLKLLIVYILLIVRTDRLIIYGALTLGVSILTALIYRIYCLKSFPETRFKFIKDKYLMREMLTFSGFDMYGNMCVVFKTQGIPIILNLFFGVIANAAASIANTLTGVLRGFSGSVLQSFRPRIIKLYASGEIVQMQNLMGYSMQLSLLVYSIIAIPIMLETNALLSFWLGTIPTYAVNFIRLIIIIVYLDIIVMINNTAIHATGNIRNISFINGTLYLLCPVLSWFVLKYFDRNVNIVYLVDIALYIIIIMLGWCFLRKQIKGININRYIKHALSSMISSILSIGLICIFYNIFPQTLTTNFDLGRLIICSVINAVLLSTLTYFLVLDKRERVIIVSIIRKKILLSHK